MKEISLLNKASKEISAIIKKVESNNEGYEKERNNWVKVVLQIEEIEGFKLQKFQAKCPVASLDDKTLYVIKDYDLLVEQNARTRNQVLVSKNLLSTGSRGHPYP